jgi:acetyl-CoA acetyltransferase
VLSGRYERVLALGVEHMSVLFSGPIAPEATDPEQATGMLLPALYALSASRYMADHGATASDLAQVAVKNSAHGALNPRAQRRQAVTEEEVLGSRPIAEPLTLFQCAGLSDAAAAAVVGGDRGDARDVPIRSSVLRSGRAWDQASDRVWGFDVVRETSDEAYAQAGIGPDDVDVVELHDAFTIGELVTLEALGLAPEGGAAQRVRAGELSLGGSQPVNPSGGLLSRGHPLGATGLAQVAELTWQLRGEAGDRQVEGARVALVETMGGGAAGIDGNGCVVAVLGG